MYVSPWIVSDCLCIDFHRIFLFCSYLLAPFTLIVYPKAADLAEEEETHHPPSDGYTPVRGAGDLPSDVHTLERRGGDPPSDGNTLVERTPSNQHDDLDEVITPRRENLMMLLKTNL